VAPSHSKSVEPLCFGVLTFVPRDLPGRPVIERLAGAIVQRGHRVVVGHHGEFHPELRPLGPGRCEVREASGPGELTEIFAPCDAVFVRWDGAFVQPAEFYLVDHLARRMPVINPPDSTLGLNNKFAVYAELARRGLPFPPTGLVRRPEEIDEVAGRIGPPPYVVKRTRGACGRAVALAESVRSLRSMADMIWSIDRREPVVIQRFLPGVGEADGPEDLRLWVVGGQLVGAARRVPRKGEFRANAALGARWEPATATILEAKTALRACQALGADYMGVDMLRTEEGPMLLDLNSNAEFAEYDAAMKTSIAARLVGLGEERVAQWRAAFGPSGPAPVHPIPLVRRAPRIATYDDAMAWLYALPRTHSLLAPERIRAALDDLGQPHLASPRVVVAGSNGKGTTCAMLERIAREAGLRTGLFTSPHLINFEERFRIDGQMIRREEVTALVRQVADHATFSAARQGWRQLCGFDAFALMAAILFRREGVDLAIYEAGLGGDCDATNGFASTLVGLGQIDLEHTELLGETAEAILGEKLGLVHPGTTLVMQQNTRLSGEARRIVEARGGTFIEVPPIPLEGTGVPGIAGPFGGANAALAQALARELAAHHSLPIGEGHLRRGVQLARWPGRMTTLCDEPLIVTDAAHTPAAVFALALEFRKVMGGRPCTLVLATAISKCRPDIVEPLARLANRIVVTEASYRAAPASAVAELVGVLGYGEKIACIEADPAKALERARAITPPEGYIFGAGGLFLTADLMRVTGCSLAQL